MSADTPIIELKDVEVTFTSRTGSLFKPNKVHAVRGVNMRIERGQTLGIVGESGCGKSTTANVMCGLQMPTKGQVFFAGEEVTKRSADARKRIGRVVSVVFQDPATALNPRMHVQDQLADPLRVHGIGDEDVRDCPSFKEIAKSLAAQIEGCDLAGFNSNRFDIPVLAEEFLRADVNIDLSKRKFVDVQTIFHKMEQRTLSAAYKFYCGKDLDDAHSAAADAKATYEVLKAQLDRYPDLKNDIRFLSEYSSFTNNVDFAGRMIYNDKGEEIFNFGKYKGRLVTEVLKADPGYYAWMMSGDFSLNTKQKLTEIRMRMK